MVPHVLRPRGPGRKKIVYMEFVAAFAILSIMALVLYMVLSYKPA